MSVCGFPLAEPSSIVACCWLYVGIVVALMCAVYIVCVVFASKWKVRSWSRERQHAPPLRNGIPGPRGSLLLGRLRFVGSGVEKERSGAPRV